MNGGMARIGGRGSVTGRSSVTGREHLKGWEGNAAGPRSGHRGTPGATTPRGTATGAPPSRARCLTGSARIVGAALLLAGALAGCTRTTRVVLAPPLRASPSPSPTSSATPSPATGAGASGPVTNPTPAASAPPECSTAELAISLGPDNPGAGTNYLPVILRNAGALPCSTGGFPGVSFVSNSGAQVGFSAKWAATAQSPPRLVVLAPGQSASALLSFVFAGNVPAADCHQAAATGLRVYPPNEAAPRVLDLSETVCTTLAWRARVAPLQPGTTGLAATR